VDEINVRMIDRFPSKTMVFYNFDSVDDDERNNYPKTFSIPSHLMVYRCTSSESRSIVPLFSSII
jgi:hypothetical protein